MKIIAVAVILSLLPFLSFADGNAESAKDLKISTVKIDGQISSPQLSIIRRAVREANSSSADFLVLDMNTPGGALDITLEIMKTLPNFKGKTVCYVNPDAISAGSYIATSCDLIYFSPAGVMGAAEAVTSVGGDIDGGMARKISSYLSAKVRAANDAHARRAEVQRAMADPEFELKIGDKVIKKKGELLSLTAKEAAEIIDGAPLLSDGTEVDIASLYKALSGDSKYEVSIIALTWADNLSKYFASISAILIGGGALLIFMDIKGGALGILSALGVGLVIIAFTGARLSGLAGYEPILIFLLGVGLLFFEIVVMPGLIFPAILGGFLMMGSIVWALGGIWPERGFEYNLDGIYVGLRQLLISIFIAIAGAVVFAKYLPKTPFWRRLVLVSSERGKASASEDVATLSAESDGGSTLRGVCVSDLMPSGRIRIGSRIVDAVSVFGHIAKGDEVEIVSKKDFNFLVKKVDSNK